MRVADWFLASPDFGLRCVVPVVPEPAWTDSLVTWCKERRVPHVLSGDFRDLAGAQGSAPYADLALSVFYDKVLPPRFIQAFGRCLNLHNGPLPRYRGMAPINWALKNQESMHGVTLHEITQDIDAGPIVAQLLYSIHPQVDEVVDVYRRALEYGFALFTQTIERIDRIDARPQDESEASYYSRRDLDRLGDRRDFTRAASLACIPTT